MDNASTDRVTRLRGLLGLTGHLLYARLSNTGRRRLLLSLAGVALAVGIVVVVAGISVGLTTQGTVVNSNVDYWIVPEGGDTSTLPVSVSGPQFGSVHSVSESLTQNPRIRYASPVAISLLKFSHAQSSEYVLAAGIIAHPGLEIAGMNTSSLTDGDPYYANGTYNGSRTGEAVISPATQDLLNVSVGDTIRGRSTTGTGTFHVQAISQGGETGLGSLPLVIVHLSELQTITGGTTHDTADQFLVATNDIGVRSTLAATYPNSRVITRGSDTMRSIANSQLALAIALAGLLIAIVIGTLFVATAMGLEITADRRLWATLLSLGFRRSSRAFLVASQTLGITLLGGLLGIGLGWLGIHVLNTTLTHYLPISGLADFQPVFGLYALGVAVLIGICSIPYLLWLTAQGEPTELLTA